MIEIPLRIRQPLCLHDVPIIQNKVNKMNFGDKIEDTMEQGKLVGEDSSPRKVS